MGKFDTIRSTLEAGISPKKGEGISQALLRTLREDDDMKKHFQQVR